MRPHCLIVVAALAACAQEPAGPAAPVQPPRELTAAEAEVVAASNRFAFDLLKTADRLNGGGNLFLSPVSASMALGMTMNGARGETLAEMREALRFGALEFGQINLSYQKLIELLLGLDEDVDSRVANSIWYDQAFPFDDAFFRTATDYFGAEVAGIPMVPSDKDRINGWVSDATNGRIPTIVDEIGDEHVMFLINAIYFKAKWTEPFDPERTRDADFRRPDGTLVRVPMMTSSGEFDHTFGDDFFAFELPYGERDAFAMTVVVPTYAIDVFVASMTDDWWRSITASLRPGRADLALPKFRLEHRQPLKETLQALGMESAFEPGGADFTGMSGQAGRNLFITDVLQKTFVEVNEEGTEAAAATSVGVGVTSLPPQLRADRPFLFAIREKHTGTIVFIGKIVDPSPS